MYLNGRYIKGERLGNGCFGCAYLVTDAYENNSRKVVKEIVVANLAEAVFQSMFMGSMNNLQQKMNECVQEASFLANLNHSNIVKFYDCFPMITFPMAYFYIVTEYCEGGNLENLLKQNRLNSITLTEQKVLTWFRELANALNYLHTLNILHRDVKPQNIFIKNEILKLGDFGLAKFQSFFGNQVRGTIIYQSPESLRNNEYTRKTDGWSLGCVFYEICTYERAFDDQYQIMNKYLSFDNIKYSELIRNIVSGLLNRNSGLRIGTTQVLNYLNPLDSQKSRTISSTSRSSSSKSIQLNPVKENNFSRYTPFITQPTLPSIQQPYPTLPQQTASFAPIITWPNSVPSIQQPYPTLPQQPQHSRF